MTVKRRGGDDAAMGGYFDTVRSMTRDPEILAAVDRAEAGTTTAALSPRQIGLRVDCPRCLAPAGRLCVYPSGHTSAQTHSARVAAGRNRTTEPPRLCPEHDMPTVGPRQTHAIAVVLGWRKSTVLHACEARFEMRRESGGATPANGATTMTDTAACDAVTYRFTDNTSDYSAEIPCTEPATVEVPLSDGRLHPRCDRHIPVMLRALARPL